MQRAPSYRRLWWGTLVAIAVPAVALRAFESPVPLLVIAATVAGISLGWCVVRAGLSWRHWIDPMVAVVVTAAAAPVLGRIAVPLLLLLSVTSVPVVRALLRAAGADPDAGPDETSYDTSYDGPLDVDACLRAMSGAELCALWRRSFIVVKSAKDVAQRAVGATIRLSVLDELERRDGTRFAAWLARRPSPASEPMWAAWLPAPTRRPRY